MGGRAFRRAGILTEEPDMSHATLTAPQPSHTREPVGDVDPTPREQDDHPTAVEGLLLEEDLLVEEVSIDGMCGVY